jgi:ATP synthase protein I
MVAAGRVAAVGCHSVNGVSTAPGSMIMFRIVILQILATLVVAAAAWLLGGAMGANASSAALSALLGGAACFVPNGLFALRLTLAARRVQGADAGTFFVGEFVKLGSTIALLALIAWAYKDVVWLAVIIAIIAALKSYMVALLLRW